MCGFLCALCTAQLTVQAAATAVVIDGTPLPGEAIARDGTAYVPLVPLLETIGGWETAWDPVERTAWADTDLFTLSVPVGEEEVRANGYAYGLGKSAVIYQNRTYVPLRSLANLLGAQVTFYSWSDPVTVTTSPVLPYTEEDLYWLSRLISAESQGESLTGQIAVGNVVLNRVKSEKFPDSIQSVIFDKKDAVQFEPVQNQTIYNEPTPQSVLAAKLALHGTNVVGECMYFFAPALSQGLWIRENCTYYTTIGCHQFYRE